MNINTTFVYTNNTIKGHNKKLIIRLSQEITKNSEEKNVQKHSIITLEKDKSLNKNYLYESWALKLRKIPREKDQQVKMIEH